MKPKVLFIMHMPPPVHGASMMGKYVHDSKLINDSFDCRYINETISNDVSKVGKFGWEKVKKIINHSRDIAKTVKDFNPDLVYITPSAYQPEIGMVRYVFEFMALNTFNCKKLIHFHNKGDKQKCRRLFFRWYYKMLFKNAKVIFLSKYLQGQFDWILKEENIKICPNGIKETLAKEIKAERHNDVVRLFFLSNLIESKGVIVLMNALKILKQKGIKIECDFVGAESVDIDAKRFNKEVKDRGLSDSVTYHGKKFGEEKNQFFKKADIFVFPTFYPGECFPLVLLEAMEYKLPLISTENGAIREIIHEGENGLICKTKDPKTLASCIECLVTNKALRQNMGEASYKMFKEYFTLSKFEHRLVECINETLDGK